MGGKKENWQAEKAVEDWYDRMQSFNDLPPAGYGPPIATTTYSLKTQGV
jgi:hypothetical protein